MFVELSHAVLKDLQEAGYNVLKSTSEWGTVSPTFRPAVIEGSVSEYLMRMDLSGELTRNRHFLVISEALTIPEWELFGVVWVEAD